MHQGMVITEHHRQQARQEWMEALQRSTGKAMHQLQEIAKKMEEGVYQKSTSLVDYQEKTRDRINSSIAKLTGSAQNRAAGGHNLAAAQYQARAQQLQAAGMGRAPNQPGHMPGMQQPMGMGGHQAPGMGMHNQHTAQGATHMSMGNQGMNTHAGMMPMRSGPYGNQPMQGMGQQHMGHMPGTQPDMSAYNPQPNQSIMEDTDFSDFLSTFTSTEPANPAMRSGPAAMSHPGGMGYPGMGMQPQQGMQPIQQPGAGMGGYGNQPNMANQAPAYGMGGGVPGQYNAGTQGMPGDRGGVGSYGMGGMQPGQGVMQGTNRAPGQPPGMAAQQQQQQQQQRNMAGMQMQGVQGAAGGQQMQRQGGYGALPQTWPQPMIPVGNAAQQQAPPQAPSPAGQPGMQPQHRPPSGMAQQQQQQPGAAGAAAHGGAGRVGAGMVPTGMNPTEENFWHLHGELRAQYLEQLKTYLVRCESSLKQRPGQRPPDEVTAKKNRDRIELFRSMISMLSHPRGTVGAPAPTRENYTLMFKWRSGVCKTLDGLAQKQPLTGAPGAGGAAPGMMPPGGGLPLAAGTPGGTGAAAGVGAPVQGGPPQAPPAITAPAQPPPRVAGTPGGLALPVHTPPINAATPPPAIPMLNPQLVQPPRPSSASAQPTPPVAATPATPAPVYAANAVPGGVPGIPGMTVKTEIETAAKPGHKDALGKVLGLLSLLEESTSGTLPGRPNQAMPLFQSSALHKPIVTPPLPAWVLPASATPAPHAPRAVMSLPSFVCNPNAQGPEPATVPPAVLSYLGMAPPPETAQLSETVLAPPGDGSSSSDDDLEELPAVLRVQGVLGGGSDGGAGGGAAGGEELRAAKRRRCSLDPQVIQEALRKVVLSGCRLSVSMSPAIVAPRDTTQLQLTFTETASVDNVSAAPAWHRLHVCVATAALHTLLDSGAGGKAGGAGGGLPYLQDVDVGCIPCLPFFASSDAGYDDQRGQMARAHFQAYLDAEASSHPTPHQPPPLLLHQAAQHWQRAVLCVLSSMKAAGSGKSLSSAEGNSRQPLMPGTAPTTPAPGQPVTAVG